MSEQPHDATPHVIGKLAESFKEGLHKVRHVAHTVVHPLEHAEAKREAEQLKENLVETMSRREHGPQVYYVGGPLGTTTTVVDRGTAYKPEAADVDSLAS